MPSTNGTTVVVTPKVIGRLRVRASKRCEAVKFTADFDFYNGLLTQLVLNVMQRLPFNFWREADVRPPGRPTVSPPSNVGTQGKAPDARGTNFMLAMVRGIGPKDEIEAMMAAQMAAVHMTTMTFARRLAHADNILQQDSAERAFNKLARTFAVQVDALSDIGLGASRRSRCST